MKRGCAAAIHFINPIYRETRSVSTALGDGVMHQSNFKLEAGIRIGENGMHFAL